jgi:predicted DNA-binding antitoxin AbrB/MazE fold protein
MLTWTIEAVYRDGVFRPLMPVALPEDTCVTIVVTGEPGHVGGKMVAPFGEMDETEWVWAAWAGSLGDAKSLDDPRRQVATEQDEG